MDLLTGLIILGGGYLLLTSRKSAAPVSPASPNSQQSAATPEVPVLTPPTILAQPNLPNVYSYPITSGSETPAAPSPADLISLGPPVGSSPPISANEITYPPDVPAGSMPQYISSAQSLIDRGYDAQSVQTFVNSWGTTDRSMEPVLLAVVPGVPDPNRYIHAGEKIPEGTAYVVTNPNGQLPMEQYYIYFDEHSYANPPNWLDLIKQTGVIV